MSSTPASRLRITVRGIVQGVGFRPWVYALAQRFACTGFVRNGGDGVVIEIEGTTTLAFLEQLRTNAPAAALILDIATDEIPLRNDTAFVIDPSAHSPVDGAFIPADLATCEDCQRELFDSNDHRHRHAFISCTNCGPRYTITAALPYDRPMTSMRDFPMCDDCAREYTDPLNRRHHAQPIACHACGPVLRIAAGSTTGAISPTDLHGDPVDSARRMLRAGGIVALRALGGYHLAVDASNDEAVQRLRLHKHRASKPFAVMVRDLDAIRLICTVSEVAARALRGADAPIVLLPRNDDPMLHIAPAVAPGMHTLGCMLPSTPLHHLLLEGDMPPLVMTSGNRSDEPIARTAEEAHLHLDDIADLFLHHDREILQRTDDSVVRELGGTLQILRRARGHVPRPIVLDAGGATILAAGAEMKSAACLAVGPLAILTQHIGELTTLESLVAFEEASAHLVRLFDARPAIVAHDLHPDTLSTRWARGDIPTPFAVSLAHATRVAVQHHHAHLASCLADNGYSDPVVGIMFDGTGYGPDGTLWGGEILVGNARAVERAAHLAPMRMPGGERAIREPWRMGMALAHRVSGETCRDHAGEASSGRTVAELDAVCGAMRMQLNTPVTTGAGRLIDGIAALVGLCSVATHEAEAAMLLESAAAQWRGEARPYGYDIIEGTPLVLSCDAAILEIVRDVRDGVPVPRIAARAHATIAALAVAGAVRVAHATGIGTVALSGGVFQNALLFEAVHRGLEAHGLRVLIHRQVPCNDGGISLGQVAVARAMQVVRQVGGRPRPPCTH